MLSFIIKDKGSEWHSKVTDDDFSIAQKELQEMQKDSEEVENLYDISVNTIAQYVETFEWFDINALKSANKESVSNFFWLLARPYVLQLEKNKLDGKYGFGADLCPTKNELNKFERFFKRKDAIGTRFTYAWGGNWTHIFSAGMQGFRLLAGPFGIIFGKIPLVAMFWFIVWVFAALMDWVILGIPYLIMQKASGLPKSYFNAESVLTPYLLGTATNANNTIREIVKNDMGMSEAYVAALWGLYMREKLVEIIRKERKE